MSHAADVQFLWRGAEEIVTDDAEILHVPALCTWMIQCHIHLVYAPITVPEFEFEQIDPEIVPKFLDTFRRQVQYEFDERCGAIVPPIELPTNA
jgi:hypothetical protein